MAKGAIKNPERHRCVECRTVTESWVLGWDEKYRCVNDAKKGPGPNLEPLPNVKDLLHRWDQSTNPVLLSAAGQLRAALRSDRRNSTAEARRA